MPFFFCKSQRSYDLCSVHCICQLGVAHAIGRVQQCCWRWERGVTCRCSSLAFHDEFKKASCVSLRDGTAKIIPELQRPAFDRAFAESHCPAALPLRWHFLMAWQNTALSSCKCSKRLIGRSPYGGG